MSVTLEGFDEAEGVGHLQKLPIFCWLNFDETRRLAAIVHLERYEDGQTILEENALGEALFVIKSGTVRVTKTDAQTGGEVELGRMGHDQLFGEMSLIDDVLTSAKVSSVGPVEVFVIPRSSFDQLLAADSVLTLKVYKAFCRTLSERLRDFHRRLVPADASQA